MIAATVEKAAPTISIEHRLARLEKESRLWRGCAIVAAAVALAALTLGRADAQPQELRAQAFTLINSQGQVVGGFDSTVGDLPSLYMYTPGRQFATVSLGVRRAIYRSPDGSEQEAPSAGLNLGWGVDARGLNLTIDGRNGAPSLRMIQAGGQNQLDISLVSNGNPSISLWGFGDYSRPIWSAP